MQGDSLTYDGKQDEVGVVLVLVNFGNELRVASGNLLRSGLDKVMRHVVGISVVLAIWSSKGGQRAVRVLYSVSVAPTTKSAYMYSPASRTRV